jgi:hypothetical protein
MNSEGLVAVLFVEVEVKVMKGAFEAGYKALLDGPSSSAGAGQFGVETT